MFSGIVYRHRLFQTLPYKALDRFCRLLQNYSHLPVFARFEARQDEFDLVICRSYTDSQTCESGRVELIDNRFEAVVSP